MATATIDGLTLYYEVHGSGPAILLMAPGGFDAAVSSWHSPRTVWGAVRPLDTFSQDWQCIAYDRRESGMSAGRIEVLSWSLYARQAKALLDSLGVREAVLLGACMGCSTAIAFAVAYPEATRGLLLHRPTGGPRWRIMARDRFQQHVDFVKKNGLKAVARLAEEVGGRTSAGDPGRRFWQVPSAGPWLSSLINQEALAQQLMALAPERYLEIVEQSAASLFDRDTVCGAEPEQLMALSIPASIVPGYDANHATSGARYLHECLTDSDYQDLTAAEQTRERIIQWVRASLSALPHR